MEERGGSLAERELRVLQDLAGEILGRLDVEATLRSVIDAVIQLTQADIAGILLAGADGDGLRMRACTGHRTAETAGLRVARGQGVAGKVFELGAPIRVDDIQRSDHASPDLAGIVRAEGTGAALGAPMCVRGEVVGVLMSWRRTGLFTDAHTATITSLATLAAIAIENARLYEAERKTVTGLTAANDRLEEQNDLLHRSSAIHDRLTRLVLDGEGIGDVALSVAAQIAGSAVVLDAELRVISATDGSEDVAARAVEHLDARPRRSEPEAGGTEIVAPNADQAWLLLREIAPGSESLGYLCLGVHHEPGPLDPVILEQAAIVCALVLTKERAVLEARTRVRSDFLWDLLSGDVRDDAAGLVWARTLRYPVPERMRLLLLRASDDGDRSARAPSVDSLVPAIQRAADAATGAVTLAGRRGPIVALLVPAAEDAGRARELAEAMVARLRSERPGLELSVGVSACAAGIGDLPQAYDQARRALSAAALVSGSSPVAVLDDLGVLRFLLAPGDHDGLARFAHNVLGSVLAYDEEHSGELVRTVEQYLAHDCSLQRTAGQLLVHPKTVRYRLDRVEEMCAIDLSRQQGRFDAQLAISIIRTVAPGPVPA